MKIIDNIKHKGIITFDKLEICSVFKPNTLRSDTIYMKINDDEALPLNNIGLKSFRYANDIELIEYDVELVIKGYK